MTSSFISFEKDLVAINLYIHIDTHLLTYACIYSFDAAIDAYIYTYKLNQVTIYTLESKFTAFLAVCMWFSQNPKNLLL